MADDVTQGYLAGLTSIVGSLARKQIENGGSLFLSMIRELIESLIRLSIHFPTTTPGWENLA